MTESSLEHWLQHLETLHPQEMELGLERVRSVANQLQLLPVAGSVVTVAGTNGKGSTCALLESVLVCAGVKTGCFTSPHMQRFNERIRIDGVEVADAEIVAAFRAIDTARESTSLTYFEFANLAALWLFRQHNVAVSILEVGLGGRLDAANIVDTDVAVITSIDLDHQQWLGDNREAIGHEKAGIMRPGVPVIIGDLNPPKSLAAYAKQVAAGPVFQYEEALQMRLFTTRGEAKIIPELTGDKVLASNRFCALQAAQLVYPALSDTDIQSGWRSLQLTGRRQHLSIAQRQYLLDVAHNPAAISRLVDVLAQIRANSSSEDCGVSPCNGKVIALFSVMKDKAVEEMLEQTEECFDCWFLADQKENERAMAAADIAELLRMRGQSMISVSKNIAQAFRRAQQIMAPGDTLVVFGSFFTVAQVLPLLEKDRRRNGTLKS